ncbi:aquaporin, partial [Ramicandelaber brevisporus]
YREYLAEFIGTAILLFLGDSVVAMTVFHKDTAGAAYLAITIGWGVALICALYVAGPISGGHFNPAVTIAAAVHRGFSWKKVPGFIAAQMVGAFVGAALVFAQYRSAFHAYDGGVRAVTGDTATAGIFATYPSAYMTHLNAVWNEFITTAMLIIAIYGCVDPRGKGAVGHSTLAIGFILIAIGLCIGHGTGYAINPARDFGPRVFTAAAGWGADVFSAADYYFWIPLIIPVPGAIFGGYVYDFFIH